MEYALIALLVYNLILTLFVIVVNNKIENIKLFNQELPTWVKEVSKETNDVTHIDTQSNNNTTESLNDKVLPKNEENLDLNDLSEKLDEVLSKTDREEIEKWIKTNPSKLNNLNKGYNKEY